MKGPLETKLSLRSSQSQGSGMGAGPASHPVPVDVAEDRSSSSEASNPLLLSTGSEHSRGSGKAAALQKSPASNEGTPKPIHNKGRSFREAATAARPVVESKGTAPSSASHGSFDIASELHLHIPASNGSGSFHETSSFSSLLDSPPGIYTSGSCSEVAAIYMTCCSQALTTTSSYHLADYETHAESFSDSDFSSEVLLSAVSHVGGAPWLGRQEEAADVTAPGGQSSRCSPVNPQGPIGEGRQGGT